MTVICIRIKKTKGQWELWEEGKIAVIISYKISIIIYAPKPWQSIGIFQIINSCRLLLITYLPRIHPFRSTKRTAIKMALFFLYVLYMELTAQFGGTGCLHFPLPKEMCAEVQCLSLTKFFKTVLNRTISTICHHFLHLKNTV